MVCVFLGLFGVVSPSLLTVAAPWLVGLSRTPDPLQ